MQWYIQRGRDSSERERGREREKERKEREKRENECAAGRSEVQYFAYKNLKASRSNLAKTRRHVIPYGNCQHDDEINN